MKKNKTFIYGSALLLLLMYMPLQTFGQTIDSVQVCENNSVSSNTVEYCETSDDFYADRWTNTDKITIDTAKLDNEFWWTSKPIKYKTDDKQLKKNLQKNYFAIRYNNVLYINTYFYKDRGVKFGKNYSRAVKMKDGKLLLPFMDVKEIFSHQAAGGMFGLVGGLLAGISSAQMAKEKVCYIITPESESAQLLDDKTMQEKLSYSDELMIKYLNEKNKRKRTKAAYIIPLLEEAGFISLTETKE